MLGMEFIDNFFDICRRLRRCSSIEEVETLKRTLKHSICDKDISTRKRKLKEVIGYSEEGGGEEFQISGNNRKLGKSRIPSVVELTKQVDGLIREVNELAARGNGGHSVSGSMNNENEFHFESRRSIFNQIMEAIKDGVRMIGIWGMPGIGKTTLVKRVAKYARDEGLFEEVAMAVVSQKPSFESIQDQIADMIGLTFTCKSIQGRAGELLKRLLAGKKILIILDDIWDSIELNDIGIPSGSQHKGCKIIFTSRKRGVCDEMGTRRNFKIDLLSEKEALSLFLQMSGVDDQCSEKGRLAEKLSEECGRLPISIAIIARGLLNKEHIYWTDMLNRLRKSDPDRKVHATIELSYDNLNREEEKMFFLLCTVFPEDYKIPIQVLFEYGLGLNLFERVDNVDEAEVRAYKLASSLKSSSLLLDEGGENFVKMHDVIRDIALAIASEGKYAFLAPRKMATSFWYDGFKKFHDVLECPQLHILMLHPRHRYFQLNDNFFHMMKDLLVLDMKFMRFVRLPQSFAALENLRTLRFSNCYLGDISAIGKLQNLICLSIYGSEIEVLPKEVGELSNLRFLDLLICERLKVITPGVIQNLSQLEVLRVESNVRWCDRKEVCRAENASLSELIHLSRLIVLEIRIPDASMLPDDLLFENLKKFKVSIGKDGPKWKNIFSSSWQMLKLSSLSENEFLKAGIKILMKKAQHLELKGISGIYVALPSHLWQFDAKFVALANLTIMSVESCNQLEYVFEHNSAKSLSKLKELEVEKCRNLKAICLSEKQDDDIVFPQLSHLKLSELESLTSFGKQVIFLALETLDIYKLEKLEKIWHIYTPVESFFQLKALKLTQCSGLFAVFPPQTAAILRNLEEICIENCYSLETLFQLDDVPLTVGDEMVFFPRLLTLKLVNLPKFTAILSTTSHNISQATVILSATKIMTPFGLQNLESIMDQQLLIFFPKLKKLEFKGIGRLSSTADPLHVIRGLEALEELMIKDNNGKTLLRVIATLPKLRKLQLQGFQSLTSLNFFSCNGVKSLLKQSALNCLVQLQELFVSECENMESVVGESGEQDFDKVIEFSKLHTLKLENLPRLASFYNGKCALKFPRLGVFSIKDCPKLKTFLFMSRETPEPSCQNFVSEEALFGQQVSFGRLRSLTLTHLESMEEIWHCCHLATTVGELVYLNVEGCDRLLKLFPSNLLAGLQNLMQLYVQSCRSLEHVFAEHVFAVEDHPPLFSNLRELTLYNLPELKQLWWNKNSRESFGLSSLHYLKIDTCPTLQFILIHQLSTVWRILEVYLLGIVHRSSK